MWIVRLALRRPYTCQAQVIQSTSPKEVAALIEEAASHKR